MTRATSIPETVTLHVPFRIVKRGGRKEMHLPDNNDGDQPRRTDNTLVKALARAFRWKRMLESGEFTTIAELAEAEGIARSYLTRILQLTLLAPDIVKAILEGRHNPVLTADVLRTTVDRCWQVQRNQMNDAKRSVSGGGGQYCRIGKATNSC